MNHLNLALRGALSGLNSSLGLIFAVAALLFGVIQLRIQLDRVRNLEKHTEGFSQKSAKFFRRQSLRRLQLAVMALLLGVCMTVGFITPHLGFPRLFAWSWAIALLVGLWAALLAVVDGISTWLSFSEERQITDAEKLALEYRMQKFQDESLKAADEAAREESDEENADGEERSDVGKDS